MMRINKQTKSHALESRAWLFYFIFPNLEIKSQFQFYNKLIKCKASEMLDRQCFQTMQFAMLDRQCFQTMQFEMLDRQCFQTMQFQMLDRQCF